MQSEVVVKFYLGKMSTLYAGDGTPDSSEELLWSGGWRSLYLWFWWLRKMHAIKHIFSAECCCQSPGRNVTRKEFTAFLNMKKCKNCTHKISPWEHLTPAGHFCQFLGSTGVPHFCSTLSTSPGRLKVSRSTACLISLSTLNFLSGGGRQQRTISSL